MIPHVLSQVGIVGGLIVYPAVTIFNWMSIHLTIKSAEKYSKVNRDQPVISMSDLGHKVFGMKGKIVIDSSISILQFSCMVMFLYTVAANLDQMACA